MVDFRSPRERPRHSGRRRRGGLSDLFLGSGVLLALIAGMLGVSSGLIDIGPDRVQGWLRGPEGDLAGQVSHVRGGDTIVVAGTPVRLANLDCAERGTPQGERATERMQQLTLDVDLTCRLTGRQSYDREIGHCAIARGEDIGRILIREGMCGRWW